MGNLPAALLLVACSLTGLALVPFGLPGLWVMVLGIVGYGWLTDFASVTTSVIAGAVGLAAGGELVEWWLGFHLARRYGGSRRAAWAALVGGLVGAVVGLPVPLIGSVAGGLVGAFVGAVVAELLGGRHPAAAVQVGWGAVVGRAAAAAAKLGCGVGIAVLAVYSMLAR